MADIKIKERLVEFIASMGLSVAQFEREAGLSNGYIRNFKGSFGGNKFDKILQAFPMLNRHWVTTGKGDMILETTMAEPQIDACYSMMPAGTTGADDDEDFDDFEDIDAIRKTYEARIEQLLAALSETQKQVSLLAEQNAKLTDTVLALTTNR